MKYSVGFLSLIVAGVMLFACTPKDPYFRMRGIVLAAKDIETVDWAKMAHENGINTIGAHFSPTSGFIQSEKGKKFLSDCEKYGITVENQMHAMSLLLPHELFSEDSTMFRMDETGRRRNDCNLCAHSEKALNIVAENALHCAGLFPTADHRYYFWIDDGLPMCACPECSKYSDSEQALLIENRMIKALRTLDPEAQLAHLAYENTRPAPRFVKPEEGIFLEFAPIERSWDSPLADEQAAGNLLARSVSHKILLQDLKDNLAVFPVETAVVLEYWLDVSLFSLWKKPAVKLPWNRAVFESDLDTYAKLGIRNITSFAVYIDDQYMKAFDNDIQFLEEYGAGLKNFRKGKGRVNPDKNKESKESIYPVTSVKNGLITIDGERKEPSWTKAISDSHFSNPWDSVCPKTSLTLLHDDKNLYFFFDANDDNLFLLPAITDSQGVDREDRIELFFSKDDAMDEYYCFEIDPKGRILSYKCSYYRNYEFDWNTPEEVMVAGQIHDYGYSVEGAIPLAWLSDFFQDDGSIYSGFYRAEFIKKDNTVNEHWLTWKDPATEKPDFHVPTSLGKIYLSAYNHK
jgi:hypothetical protein